MARKRARDLDTEDLSPQSTPKKLRFGEPVQTHTKRTPTRNALKQTGNANGTSRPTLADAEEAATPKRGSDKRRSYNTPSKHARNGSENASYTPASTQTAQNADHSARRRKNRHLIERTLAGGQSDEEQDNTPIDPLDARDEENEDADATEQGVTTTQGASESNTPSKRGRGRPPGAKNKRTPTPPPDIPAHERYFFENRPAAAKQSSHTPNEVALLSHAAYLSAIRRCDYDDRHAGAIQNLHAHHASKFPQWAFELREGYTVALHGYGSKRRLLQNFMDFLHSNAGSEIVQATVAANAHHPAFTLRHMLQALLRGVDLDPADRPTPASALLETILQHLSSPSGQKYRVYLLIRTLTARSLMTPAAISTLTTLAAHPRISLLVTSDNPSFPLLWPSSVRDSLNIIFHDATTFLPYDSTDVSLQSEEASLKPPVGEITELGASAVDAVAELLGKRTTAAASRERVSWVLRSLPENAKGLYRIIVSEILAIVDGDSEPGSWSGGFAEDDDEDEFGESARNSKRGKERKTRGGHMAEELLVVDSKIIYQKASEEFLCSSETAFRGLLREFLDHAMVVIRRDGIGGSGGEMLGIEMGKSELEGVLEDLVM